MSLRASQINGCGWCIDIHAKEAAAAGESAVRLNLVAGLARVHRLHRGGARRAGVRRGGHPARRRAPGVSDETWAQVRKHYDDDQIAALVCQVGLINAANRLAVIVHQQGGSYEPGMFAKVDN